LSSGSQSEQQSPQQSSQTSQEQKLQSQQNQTEKSQSQPEVKIVEKIIYKTKPYRKLDKAYWEKLGERNVKTAHATSGRHRKETSTNTTGKTAPPAAGSSDTAKLKEPAKKKPRSYLPF
jgi:hypothetical protein